MVFSSLEFLFRFLPIFLFVYYVTPAKWRNVTLLLGSIVFYTVGQPALLPLLLASVVINYAVARGMNRKGARKKLRLAIALIFDFGMLFFFKYSGFVAENLNLLFGKITGNAALLPVPKMTLPLGISFYTFQIVGYVVDVYRGKIKTETSLIRLGTYLTMFPKLTAGPIVPYEKMRGSICERTVTAEDLEEGTKWLIIGLGAKVIVAERIGSLWSSIQMIGFESISTPLAWMGAFAYSLQLYFDFSGYSMMAIGLGKMLGFEIPVNFDHPYISKSLTEFWRRWHISLGRWFREYVYIPLGGNRVGKGRMLVNIVVVWMLTAIWHGAGWNFMLWGVLLFSFMILEKLLLLKYLEKSRVLSRIYMLILIPVSWVIFAIGDIGQLGVYLGRMFQFFAKTSVTINHLDYLKYLKDYWGLFLIAVFFSTPFPTAYYKVIRKKPLGIAVTAVILLISLYYLSISANNPFMYFNF